MSERDNFRVNTFLMVVDTLLTSLRRRREVYMQFAKKFQFLNTLLSKPEEMSVEKINDQAVHLQNCYPQDFMDLDDLKNELEHFLAHVQSKKLDLSEISNIMHFYKWFIKMNLNGVYENIDIVFRLCLCAAATNCSAERCFSCLKRIENYLRSTQKQERIDGLAILNIEAEIATSLSYEDIINQFSAAKARKVLL
jgi:hypothetical protein